VNNNENKQPSSGRSGLQRFLEAQLTLQNSIILFWACYALIDLVFTYAPGRVTTSLWFIVTARVMFELVIALWVAANGRAHDFEEQRLKWYIVFSILAAEFTVPIYLVKSRGWTGAAKTSLRFAGYLCLAIVILAALAGVLQIFGIYETGRQHT
jgi:hypothetical protein